MTKGFYQLTSGILSQTKRLDVVGNNMTNLTTSGYKAETYTDRTFQEVLYSRVGNVDKSDATVIGGQSYMLAPDTLYINYERGTIRETGLTLDFAIVGDGFFAIQTDNGVEYTRGGSFCLNEQNQLYLEGQGTVLGVDGQPITLDTDQIRADTSGRIYTEQGVYQGQLGVYVFADNQQLTKGESGLFQANGQVAQLQGQPEVAWKSVEESNVDMLQEMSRMLTAQRNLQSGAQVLKLYDNLLTKATTQIAQM